MNIMVCIKQVLDNATVPKLNPATGQIVTEGVETMVSPFDLNALEGALRLAEAHGGEVSVITVGDENCKPSLRLGLAMGAAHAYLVTPPADQVQDSWSAAYLLSKAIENLGPFDLVLCGKQAIDDDASQVGGSIARLLNMAQVTYVEEIVEASSESITVKRAGNSGSEVIEAKLPTLLTCEKSLGEPRYPTLKKTRMANRAEIPTLDCAGIGADADKAGAIVKVQKIYAPAPRQGGELLKGEAEEIAKIAVAKLVEQKVI